MSYRGLMQHRCDLLELQDSQIDGMAAQEWTVIGANVRCFLDLTFMRHGKDPMWTPEAGRATERTGVAFFPPNVPVLSGQRMIMKVGPTGIFSIEGAVDPVWSPKKLHHWEASVQEVGNPLARGAYDGS